MSARRQINVAFVRFWPGFDPGNNLFTRLLSESYDVRLDHDPELVFYSVFGGSMPAGKYIKVFYTGECVRPPWKECDWAFSFDYDDHPRHYRLPNYVFEDGDCQSLIKSPDKIAAWRQAKTRFCNFVYFKSKRFRNDFFKRLARRRHIDAPGRCMQNMPPIGSCDAPVKSRFAKEYWKDKVAFLQPYRFTIAFENRSFPGYTTEKLYHAMRAGSIPIYYGDPLVQRDFNPRSFINYHDYEAAVASQVPAFLRRLPLVRSLLERWYVRPRAMESIVERVLEMCEDDELYIQCLSEPWFHGNQPPDVFDLERLKRRLDEIVAGLTSKVEIGQSCSGR